MVKAGDKVKIVKDNHILQQMGICLGEELPLVEASQDGVSVLRAFKNEKAWFNLTDAYGPTGWIGFVDKVPEFDAHTRQYGREKTSLCECGGHRAGFKDYTRQHYSWCPVYKE